MKLRTSKTGTLTGIEKTAILMNILGEEKSFELMQRMKDSDVRRLLNIMNSMKKAPIKLINTVLAEFLFKISEHEEIIFDEQLADPEKVKKGLGEERAKHIFGKSKSVNLVHRKGLSVLDSIDNVTLGEYLVGEHPQTIALILAHLDLDRQMALIKLFPDTIRTEVILRMSNLEYVDTNKLEELDETLKEELWKGGNLRREQLGGVMAAADLVNGLDKKMMNSILTRLEDKDPLLAEEIRQNMFTFSDMVKIDDRGIQQILREVPSDRLLLSLKTAPDEVRVKVFGAMSGRAADMLREDLAALGPQKVSDIEAAQRDVVNVIKRLEEEGKIVIGIGEESEIVP